MANRSRTVDPALWQKPDFMRATPVARELWLGMICTCADDEGRFEADVWAITQRLFPRSHPATETDVQAGMDYWQNCGWLLIYQHDGRTNLGFLQGWFEHQYIREPEPSSFLPPPIEIASWRDVQAIKEWHKKERGGNDNTHFRTFLRDFEQARQSDRKLTVARVRTKYPLTTKKVRVEGKGRKGNRIEGNPIEGNGDAPAGATEPPPDQLGHMEACHSRIVAACVAYFHDIKAPEEAQEYGLSIVRQLKAENAGITGEAVLEALASKRGPKSGQEQSKSFGAEKFLQRLIDAIGDGKKQPLFKRGQSVTEPASADDFDLAIRQQQEAARDAAARS